MKYRLSPFFVLLLAFALPAVAQPEDETSAPVQPARFSTDQLDKLLGPIALYPDALIALILPASTASSDVVLAARFLGEQRDLGQVDAQPWDDSVKALIHYPDVIKWMDANLAWTKQLGDAFLGQPAEVMSSVQHLRAQAKAAGSLVDTPQQQVVEEDQNIEIVPTQPDVIYVPSYDPAYVYESRPGFYDDPFITFGVGYATGFWLGYDLDWHHRRVWCVDPRDRDRYWREHGDWRHPVFPGRPDYVRDSGRHPWRPAPGYPRLSQSARTAINRPAPFPRSAGSDDGRRQDNDRGQRDRNDNRPRDGHDYANNRRAEIDAARVNSDPGRVNIDRRAQEQRPRLDRNDRNAAVPARSTAPAQTISRPTEPAPARAVQTRSAPDKTDNPYGQTRGTTPPPPRPAPAPASREARSAPAPAPRAAPQRESASDNSDRNRQSRR